MKEPIKVIAQIIQEELGLSDGQVMLAYEKWVIPENSGLYVALRYVSTKPLSVRSWFDSDLNVEVKSVTLHNIIQIDMMSFDDSARARRAEAIMALCSFRSQRLQEENVMQIARLPGDFMDTSSLEETKFLKRFTAHVAVKSVEVKQSATPYFDVFPDGSVLVADGRDVEKEFSHANPYE